MRYNKSIENKYCSLEKIKHRASIKLYLNVYHRIHVEHLSVVNRIENPGGKERMDKVQFPRRKLHLRPTVESIVENLSVCTRVNHDIAVCYENRANVSQGHRMRSS